MKNQETIEYIVGWLKAYTEKSATKGFIVGVSGGIDSALTSYLAALTGFPVTCVEMPIYQSPSQVNRARKHIENLQTRFANVSRSEVDLSPVFEHFIESLPPVASSEAKEMSLVNSRARLRMTTLYYFAALEGKLVVGTGNKVEDFGVGFYTKYGDGGVDLSPIADLYKSQVYELAKELGIIDEILIAPPTDGLWGDDRTDEDQLGASYPELEWAMEQEKINKTAQDFLGREAEVMSIYEKYNRANKHKMLAIPICEIPVDLVKEA
jgi:NAD+ synthase